MGMWTPRHGGGKLVAMRQTEDHQAQEKLDDVCKSGSEACAHLI